MKIVAASFDPQPLAADDPRHRAVVRESARMKRSFSKAFFLVLLTLISVSGENIVKAQGEPEAEIVPATAGGCQRNTINIANLNALLTTTKETAFVIAHPGTGETSPRLNRRRLHDVRAEFGQISSGSSAKIILAEGGRVEGRGRVEFYLGSELMHVSLLARNGGFCSSCCDGKRLFYGNIPAGRSKRKKRR
jgi:hypothetical protein